MKHREKDIRDDEIRVIGEDMGNGRRFPVRLVLIVIGAVAAIALLWWAIASHRKSEEPPVEPDEPGLFEPSVPPVAPPAVKMPLAKAEDIGKGFIEMADTTVNDIPMRLYLPHRVSLSLHLGPIDRDDDGILFCAQAADIRADNGGIVGAFVLDGEPKAWGLSKRGYCAIIDGVVTVGVADNSPLFEEATEKGGCFFRQFPLVDNGQLVENEQKGKSVRRALCERNGEVFTVETLSIESFHDFAQALVDLGIDNAIYLVGANAYGWATDADGQRHEFGDPNPKADRKKWRNINYLVMREAD